MPFVFELEVWTRPGRVVPRDYGKSIAERAHTEIGIDSTKFIGLTNTPGDSDMLNLDVAIQEGEVDLQEFDFFCKQNHLDPSTTSSASACLFLSYLYGESIAWLHLSHSAEGLIDLGRVLDWCQQNSFNVQDGQLLYCLLQQPSVKPIGW